MMAQLDTSPPRTQKFAAWINLTPGNDPTLIITGEVETKSTADRPVLTFADPPVPMPSTLSLDLSIRNSGGIGNQVFSFLPVRYMTAANQGQYDTVRILWRDEELLNLTVTEAH